MSTVIWKYPLKFADKQHLQLPNGAEIIGIFEQREKFVLYAKVNPDAPTEARTILMFGTGHLWPEELLQGRFIATVPSDNGTFMWHFYEYER